MKTKALLTVGCLFFYMVVIAQPVVDPDESVCIKEEKNVIALVTQIYEEISSDGEKEVNWEKVKSYFIEGAIIILRTSPYDSKQFTVEQFIQDFKNFYQNPGVLESGFKEEVLSVESRVYKNIAFVSVVYSAKILNSANPAHKGIDFWLLGKKDHAWKVMAINNEIITPNEEIPKWLDPEYLNI